jgi:beta-glucosidase
MSLALVNMARAHRAARTALRGRFPDALVGFAHSAPLVQPCDPSRAADRGAAWLRDLVLNRAFFRLLEGARPHRSPPFDFIGINYYTRAVVRGGAGVMPFAGTECLSDHHADRGPRSDTGWEVYPAGMLFTLRRFSRYGVPLLITENGVATSDEELRTRFLVEHLAGVAEALAEGIDVRGYFWWSLMDNVEWALGTTARFGLFEVDFHTQRRTARPVLDRYREVCRTGRLVVPAAPPSGEPDGDRPRPLSGHSGVGTA